MGVLDIGYMDSSEQTYSMLSAPLKDFNNKTSMEIAHDAGYIGFIAHPCCQKWLTRKLFGAIHVKELDLGFLTLPNWFKVSQWMLGDLMGFTSLFYCPLYSVIDPLILLVHLSVSFK